MTDSDEYGFFCDLETAKTMEYDKLEYYVVTKTTHWEVRRKLSEPETEPVKNAKMNLGNKNGNKRVDTFQKEFKVPTSETPKDDSSEDSNVSFCACSYIQKIPRDVYYSFVVCLSTISCVYFVMTFPVDE